MGRGFTGGQRVEWRRESALGSTRSTLEDGGNAGAGTRPPTWPELLCWVEVFFDDPLGLPLVGFAFLAGEIDFGRRVAAGVQGEGVADFLLPGFHRGGEACDVGGVGGIVVNGARFVGIVLQIEELAVTEFWITDKFPAFVAHGALDLDVGEEDGVAEALFGVGPERADALAEDAGGRSDTGEFAERRENIEEVGECLDGFALGDAGAADDEGRAHRVFEYALFAEEAMAAEGEAVVGGVDDDGVVGETAGFERGEEAADLGVEVLDHCVVFGELVADHRFGARPGTEVFVAAAAHGAVVEGELRKKVFRERRAGGVVGREAGRGLPGVVRGGEGDVAEKWFRVGLR